MRRHHAALKHQCSITVSDVMDWNLPTIWVAASFNKMFRRKRESNLPVLSVADRAVRRHGLLTPVAVTSGIVTTTVCPDGGDVTWQSSLGA